MSKLSRQTREKSKKVNPNSFCPNLTSYFVSRKLAFPLCIQSIFCMHMCIQKILFMHNCICTYKKLYAHVHAMNISSCQCKQLGNHHPDFLGGKEFEDKNARMEIQVSGTL